MSLSQEIKQYYFDHFDELPQDKQFHFSSRLAAWQGDQTAIDALYNLRDHMVSGQNIDGLLREILTKPAGRLYGKPVRQVFFDKYPALFGIHNCLFRIRHLKDIYGIDARQDFLGLVNAEDLEKLYSELTRDHEALRILSRFAVDFIYLYEILYEASNRLDPTVILNQDIKYDLDDTTQLHLFIYLYTHAIIADTNFYERPVPLDRLDVYRLMLSRLEGIVAKRANIKLDNKFEFLVACRICGVDSVLFKKINNEAATALSPYGRFIIDELNGAPAAGLNGFARSEHRNVLFVMSCSAYRPKAVSLK